MVFERYIYHGKILNGKTYKDSTNDVDLGTGLSTVFAQPSTDGGVFGKSV